MPQAGEIYSNLKRSTRSYDEELAVPQAHLDFLATLPQGEREPDPLEAEALFNYRVAAYAGAADRRWANQHRFMGKENEAMRFVNLMHPHKIFRKLQRAGVDARIEAPSFYVWVPEDKTGKLIKVKKERSVGRLWLHDEVVAGRVGVSAWVRGTRQMVTTLQYPYGPEWSLLHFDENDVPICEKYRGWRTALLALILAGVLTEDEVNRAFGPVSLSPVSIIYREHLYYHRQKKMGLVQ